MCRKTQTDPDDQKSQFGDFLFDNGGMLSRTRYFHALPRHHEQKAERFVAISQVALALLIVAVNMIAGDGTWPGSLNWAVAVAFSAVVASSGLRWAIGSRQVLPDTTLDALTLTDIAALFALTIACSHAGNPSANDFESGQLAIWVAVLITMRVVRVHPRPVLVAGSAAIFGLIAVEGLVSFDRELNTTVDQLDGGIGSVLAVSVFVGLLTYATWQARQSLWHLNATLETMPHGVALFDKDDRLVVSNSQYSRLYGLDDRHRERGTSITELIRYRHENGCFGDVDFNSHSTDWMNSFTASEASIQELDDGRVFSILRQREPDGRIVTTTEDVTSQRRLEARVEHLAYHDPLTDLANRTKLRERLDQILLQNREDDGVTAFCMDLDRFKEINDTLGHHIGDDLLKAVADRLRESVRDGDIVARTGGDEFVILQLGKCTYTRARALAQRIIERLTTPFDLRGYQVLIGVSIGIATPNGRDNDAEDLIKNADIALYKAKESGRGTFCFYEDSMCRRLQERHNLESDLRKTLKMGEFELHYQPIMSVGNGEIEGVEALIRWHHPERGMVPPSEFISIADEIGMAVPLGNWVILQACKDAASLSGDMTVSVNVSAAQFHKPGLADTIADTLRSTGLDANRLELEITETVLLDNSRMTISTLNQLHKLGVRIAMDDFGTGYSSLSYLQKFSFDRLKIDRSFVSNAITDSSSSEFIRIVIDLGQRLGMAITAEGVETDEELDRVTSDGCTAVQGFLISPPLPLSELIEFLHTRKNRNDFPQRKPTLRQVGQ